MHGRLYLKTELLEGRCVFIYLKMNVRTRLFLRYSCSCFKHTSKQSIIPFRCHQKGTSQPAQHVKRSEKSGFSPAATSTHDWIGPPDRLSNLRPIIYHIPVNETPLERKLRHLRQETEDWNHTFWAHQNLTFNKEKEAYVKSQLKSKELSERDDDGRKRTLSSENMAVFYKQFLDKNMTKHSKYNREWYRRNFAITVLMAKVTLHNTWSKITGQKKSKAK